MAIDEDTAAYSLMFRKYTNLRESAAIDPYVKSVYTMLESQLPNWQNVVE